MSLLGKVRFWSLAGLTAAACAKAENLGGPGDGAAGMPFGGTAGVSSGGAAGTSTGGAAGTSTGGVAGGGTGGLAGSAADAATDVGSDVDAFADAQPDGVVTVPGLNGFWRFEETTGPVFDYSGNNLHGTAQGAGLTRGATGHSGNAISFGGTDGAVKIPTSPKLDFTSGATIEFWIKLSSVTLGTILSRGTGSGDSHVRIKTQAGNVNVSFGKAGLGAATLISSTGVLPTQQWTHVAVVNDGSQLRLYVSGKLVTSAPGGYLGSMSQDLYLGKSLASDTSLNGTLDEVQWFDVARSDQEICSDAGASWVAAESGFICQ
jgi:hypothetical protein